MDSLSQALLGASTFALVQHKHIGKSSLVIGALAGTLPDLDVLLAPFFHEVAFITVHRSFSHSILFAILGSLFFGYLAHKMTRFRYRLKDWTWAFFLAFFTHSLLDWCTTYGTKMLCPFHGHLFSINSIHVIEPIYTAILLLGVGLFFFKSMTIPQRDKVLRYTLAFSTLYLCWTFVSKGMANRQFVKEIQARNITYEKMLVSPTPFNTLLWNGIIKTKQGYYFGSYSLLDSREHIDLQFVKSDNEWLPEIQKFKRGRQYLEFTQDFPLVQVDQNMVKIYAIKFGPVNYFGKPEFVYPLCIPLDGTATQAFKIDCDQQKGGPVKDYQQLLKRIKGI